MNGGAWCPVSLVASHATQPTCAHVCGCVLTFPRLVRRSLDDWGDRRDYADLNIVDGRYRPDIDPYSSPRGQRRLYERDIHDSPDPRRSPRGYGTSRDRGWERDRERGRERRRSRTPPKRYNGDDLDGRDRHRDREDERSRPSQRSRYERDRSPPRAGRDSDRDHHRPQSPRRFRSHKEHRDEVPVAAQHVLSPLCCHVVLTWQLTSVHALMLCVHARGEWAAVPFGKETR